MVLLGLALYLPLFFQGVLQLPPTTTGLIMTPFSLSMVAGAILSGIAMSRLKRYRVVAIVAALLMSVGAFLITLLNEASAIPLAIGFMVLAGVGIGSFFSLPTVAVQNALPGNQLGVGTAALRYLGQVGATLGVAIVGAAITSGTSGDLIGAQPASEASVHTLTGALQQGFLAVLAFAVVALVVSFFLKESPIPATQTNDESDLSLTHAALG
jgi:MFS family permease